MENHSEENLDPIEMKYILVNDPPTHYFIRPIENKKKRIEISILFTIGICFFIIGIIVGILLTQNF